MSPGGRSFSRASRRAPWSGAVWRERAAARACWTGVGNLAKVSRRVSGDVAGRAPLFSKAWMRARPAVSSDFPRKAWRRRGRSRTPASAKCAGRRRSCSGVKERVARRAAAAARVVGEARAPRRKAKLASSAGAGGRRARAWWRRAGSAWEALARGVRAAEKAARSCGGSFVRRVSRSGRAWGLLWVMRRARGAFQASGRAAGGKSARVSRRRLVLSGWEGSESS